VATSGDDTQANTPPDKLGGSFSYAYATIGAACARAEDLIELVKKSLDPIDNC